MNRFFRSALFPLIVIVLLVFLASRTLIPSGEETEKVTYSELAQQAQNGNVQEVLFTPSRQQIDATLVSGEKVKVNYVSDVSALELEQVLKDENITYDS
ncbi:MAG: hypothetical protein K0T00_2220, partial [Gaiellaceae bacterium]|nr:hypothetical protein [Gaiellaceae bacterium]